MPRLFSAHRWLVDLALFEHARALTAARLDFFEPIGVARAQMELLYREAVARARRVASALYDA